MNWISTVKEIGPAAIDKKENIIILFDDKALPDIRRVSVIQDFKNGDQGTFSISKNDKIIIRDLPYQVMQVGELVEEDVREMGHVTLVFIDEVPTKPMRNAIYLYKKDEDTIPDIHINDTITYEHREEMK